MKSAMRRDRSRWSCVCVLLLALWAPSAGAEDAKHPLEPPDLSSPRATLNHFLTTGDEFSRLLQEKHWDRPSLAFVKRIEKFELARQRLFDLSEIPPAARSELVRDAMHYLYDVLARIELPPEADIPDASAFEETTGQTDEGGEKPVSWTIPHTEITFVRVSNGPRAGEFVFSSETVARAREFYEKARVLPYRRDVPLKNYVEMRRYLSLKSSLIPSRTIEGFPDWLKRSTFQQATWKWIALVVLLILTVAVVVIVDRSARRGLLRQSVGDHLRRVVTPLALLLLPLMLHLANRGFTLTGWVSGGVTLVAQGVTYLALAWIAWTALIALAEAVIASPRISDQSLNAHLLRLLARTAGIAVIIAIVFYVSNQLGAPLYGLVAGLGVGGIAVALAIRPFLENILGSVALFADKPIRVGDFCRFGNDLGTVEAIGLRSTRLRKLDDTLVSIPNADFSQRELTNLTRRRRRLYKTTLGLRYETSPEQLRYLLAKLREMLIAHPKVSGDDLHVRFQGFGAYSLDIVVFAYIRTRDWLTYRAIREDINLRIMDIVKETGTGFAFPSQTAYVGRDAGLDAELGQNAETQVQAWRSKGQLPFPEFAEDLVADKKNVLDYPPEGSPGYEPRLDVAEAEREPSQEPTRKSTGSRIKKVITPLRRKKS